MLSLVRFSVANNLFLGFWTSQSIHGFKSGDYMATYAALGVAIAIFSFTLSFTIRCVVLLPMVSHFNDCFSLTTLSAGLAMFKACLTAVLRSAVSFFDTTPMGMDYLIFSSIPMLSPFYLNRTRNVSPVEGPRHS